MCTCSRTKPERPIYRFLSGDVNFADYGGSWWSYQGSRIFIVRKLITRWQDESMSTKYKLLKYEVDLDEIESYRQDAVKSACSYAGKFRSDYNELSDLERAEILASYGEGFDDSDILEGDNLAELFKESRLWIT